MNLLPWLRVAADRAATEHNWSEFARLRDLAMIAAAQLKERAA